MKVVFRKVNCIFFLSEVVKQKGLEHITVDDLVAEITPKGRCKLFTCSSFTTDSFLEL